MSDFGKKRAIASVLLGLCTGCSNDPGTTEDSSESNSDAAMGGADTRGSKQGDGESNIVVGDKPDVPPLECEREITFQAVELSEPPPFDVVIVADHSDSLSWSRDDLAQGLSNLLDNVKGSDARFFVLTPTQYGESSAGAIDYFRGVDLVVWADPVSGVPYDQPMTDYVQECVDEEGMVITCPEYPNYDVAFTLNGTWNFNMPDPVAAISAEMSSEEFQAQQVAISDAILGLKDGGSQYEQPLCTLNRYVAQAPEALPDNVVFIVLSDEDDTSIPDDCMESYEYWRETVDSSSKKLGCESDCEGYRYRVSAPAPLDRLDYRCVPVNDLGETSPDQARDEFLTLNVAKCDEALVAECDEEEVKRVTAACGGGAVIESCEHSCDDGGAVDLCTLFLEGDKMDCDSPFEYEGVSYANFLDYCVDSRGAAEWSTCQPIYGYITEEGAPTFSGGAYERSLVSGDSSDDLIRAFQSSASAAFASGSYAVTVIGFDPSLSCIPQTGQSHATMLSRIATNPEGVFPICESYAPALKQVAEFATSLLETEYLLDLSDIEFVAGVTINDSLGQERSLDESEFTYSVEMKVLQLLPEAIEANDVSLSVEAEIDCSLVIR